jgi:hypothetical protein
MSARFAFAAALAGLALAACESLVPAGPLAAREVALPNAGFEEGALQAHCAPRWACVMHADPDSFRFFVDESSAAGGRRALCIEPVRNEPWALATQASFDPALHGRRVRFSLAVRTEGVTGHGAGVIAKAHGGHGEMLVSRESLVTGTQGWKRLAVELDVPRGASDVEVGGMLAGKGRLCIDDARLEVVR